MKKRELLKHVITTQGTYLQTMVAIEEMSELTKELSKAIRGFDNHNEIVEELADVMIMLEQLTIMYQVNELELNEMMMVKLNRLEERIKNESI